MSEENKIQGQQCAVKGGYRTMCGGQAIIEGIMMRGPQKQAIVVRDPEGELVIREEEIRFIKERYPILGLPFIRGVVNFMDSMVNGMKALMFSAEYYPDEEDMEPSKFDIWLEKKFGNEKAQTFIIYLAAALGVLMSVGLFFVLPTFLGSITLLFTDSMLVRNITESLVKIVIFVGYLAFCSTLKDIRRVFQYHGAEHKTIFCYEAGLPLTVENVRKQSCHHPRCGTSFLFVVIFVSILASTVVFYFWPVSNVFLRTLAHLVMLPFVVAVSYEFNRYAGRHEQGIIRFFIAPGLFLQNFTTFEPDDSMIEVGIRALQLVLPEEQGQDLW